MAKKVRRVRKSGNRSKTVDETNEQPAATSSPRNRQDATQRFQLEYAYVLKDLRHILILAGIMFILLIILNILLQ